MNLNCRTCGTAIEQPTGSGRRRKYCHTCSPKRRHPDRFPHRFPLFSYIGSRICRYCGKAIEARGNRGPWPTFCSRLCGVRNCSRDKRIRQWKQLSCVACGGVFWGSEKATRCERCRLTREEERHRRSCCVCLRTFLAKRGAKTCSRKCHTILVVRNSPTSYGAGLCPWCDASFNRIRPNQVYCSTRCENASSCFRKRSRRKTAGFRRDLGDAFCGRGRTSKAFSIVWERDGGVCQLCHHAINLKERSRSKLAPTLDHIIPVSANGTNEVSNLQLAHMKCNASKNARMGFQLRLF